MADLPALLVDEAGLQELAGQLASVLQPPLCLYLHGDLGAGKTTFVRALLHALGYSGRVKSPTYGILEQYELESCTVLHLDLYRLNDAAELDFLGLADLFDANTLLLVEWPRHGQGRLPAADIDLFIEHAGEQRRVSLMAHSSSGNVLCDYFHKLL
jgi:tRNA threonylcarbamoyladenosine biosynthesis protein TsaE